MDSQIKVFGAIAIVIVLVITIFYLRKADENELPEERDEPEVYQEEIEEELNDDVINNE